MSVLRLFCIRRCIHLRPRRCIVSDGEQWRDVVGYEGRYRVSDRARIQNVLSGRILTGSPNAGGYFIVRLTDGRGVGRMHYLHRLVCRAFNGPPPSPEHVVNHVSGQKLDCRPENLCWCTRRENCEHAARLGLCKGRPGSTNPNARLNEEEVVEMRRRSREGVSYSQLARENCVSVTAAYRAIVGHSWRHLPLSPAHDQVLAQ
jgi:hypothetical protein